MKTPLHLGVLSCIAFATCFATPENPKKPAVEDGSFEQQAGELIWECTTNPALPNVLILGDSISIGYTLKVRELLKDKANVFRPVRRGKPENCFTAKNGLEHFDEWIGQKQWSVIHFNFGLHDLKYVSGDKLTGKQESPIEDYKVNLEALMPMMKKTGAHLIFATTTTVPADEKIRAEGDEIKYNAAALAVMKAQGVTVNDLHALTASFPTELFKKAANVHYSDEGSSRLAKQVADRIEATLVK